MVAPNLVLPVHDASEVGAARRAAVAEAERLGAAEEEAGKVALIITELATNLARHGGGGEVLVRTLTQPAGLEIGQQLLTCLPGCGERLDLGRDERLIMRFRTRVPCLHAASLQRRTPHRYWPAA